MKQSFVVAMHASMPSMCLSLLEERKNEGMHTLKNQKYCKMFPSQQTLHETCATFDGRGWLLII